MRTMPVDSSVAGLLSVSSSTPGEILSVVLLLATSRPSVTVISLTQMKRCLKMPLNSASETLPSASASMWANMAVRRSSLKSNSSRLRASGSLTRWAEKASLDKLSAPPENSLYRASCVSSLAFMWSRRAEANVITLTPTKNLRPPSSVSGAHVLSEVFSASSSMLRVSAASASTFFALYFCSCALATFLCLAISVCISFSLACSSFKVSTCPGLPAASFARAVRNVAASPTKEALSFICSTSFSHAASSWPSTSLPSSPTKGAVASANFLTLTSAAATFSPASCMRAVFLRPSVSFLKMLSLAEAALMRSVSWANSSAAGFEAASPNLRISRFFEAMKVRAPFTADCTASAAVSESAIVAFASVRAMTSIPFRNGSSTSLTFSKQASTWATFSLPSRTKASLTTRSRWSFVIAMSSVILD
mmetsp:Transcript_90376/g.238384  ORF Transcript_90376/g.238384 Transcript_90376/m.238384 type:complete len:421 (-) Transcript_90376:2039-3301(-)